MEGGSGRAWGHRQQPCEVTGRGSAPSPTPVVFVVFRPGRGAFLSTMGVCVALGLTMEVSCHHHQALGALGKSEEQDSGE